VARRGISDNLVSDIPGLAAITNPELLTSTATSPFWIISEQVTNVTDSTNVSKVTTVDPPSGDVSIPTMGSDPQQWPIEAFTLSLLAMASPTPETPWRPALMFERYAPPLAPFHRQQLEVRWYLFILWAFLFWMLARSAGAARESSPPVSCS
jgi:hypothetical protein